MSESVSVRVWQQPDRLWRWRWVQCDEDGEEQTSLTSHMAFDSVSEAVHSAQEAYPGVPVQMPDAGRRRRPRRRFRRRLLAGAVAGAILLAWRRRDGKDRRRRRAR